MTKSVRGAGKDRPGATDTTMLIWKTIHANTGITRDDIFAKIEHQIPAGWARRRYAVQYEGRVLPAEDAAGKLLRRARGFVLTHTLQAMRTNGSVVRNEDRAYSTVRKPRYFGNPDHIDETGTKAAQHLNAAYAVPKIRAFIARANPKAARMTEPEFRALEAYFKNIP